MSKELREKVINGLECCINERKNITDCEHCPYCEIDEACTSLDDLHSDALALLKAQEPVLVKPYTEIEYGFKPKVKVGKCPNCGRIMNEQCNYCSKCGRAVKWDG